MNAWIVEYDLEVGTENDYLLPSEYFGRYAFGGKEDADKLAEHFRKYGVKDSYDCMNRCKSVTVHEGNVPHAFVRHQLPKWVKP